jgi:homoserine kinase
MRARAPASTANLGPGFDALAIALNLYVQVEVEPAAEFVIRSEGEGAGTCDDTTHLAARVVKRVLGHDRVAIMVRSQIPVARGLGSSAALAVAAAAAAGAEDPFAVGAEVDGHAENAAASAMGGLVTAGTTDGHPYAVHLALSDSLAFVVIVPDHSLPTPDARRVLPGTVSREDATFNLGRMGLLLAGLTDPSVLRTEATADRLHQDARTALFPEAPQLLDGLVQAGALASCWSGAGPSLLGITTKLDAEHVRMGSERALHAAGLPGRVLLLQADLAGVVSGDEATWPP